MNRYPTGWIYRFQWPNAYRKLKSPRARSNSAKVRLQELENRSVPAMIAPLAAAPPDLEITKGVVDVNGGMASRGDILEYSITVKNNKSEDFWHVFVTDAIPANTTYEAGSLEIVSGANAGAKTDALGDDQAEFDPENNRVVFLLGDGAGEPCNDGGGGAGAGLLAAEASTLCGGKLAPGESTTVRFRVRINADAPDDEMISNQARVDALGDEQGNTSWYAESKPVYTALSPPVVLGVTKDVVDINGGTATRGDLLEYTVTVKNNGNYTANNVWLIDAIPANTTYEAGSLEIVSGANAGAKTDALGDDQGTFDPENNRILFLLGDGAGVATADDDYSCENSGGGGGGGGLLLRPFMAMDEQGHGGGSLAPGESTTIRFRVRINADVPDGTEINNRAEAKACDPVTEMTVTVPSDWARVVLPPPSPAKLETTKTVSDLNGGSVVQGDTLEYVIVVRNTGDGTASHVSLVDAIPANTTYEAGSLEIVSGANAGAKTDALGDDQAEFDPENNRVVFLLGDGAGEPCNDGGGGAGAGLLAAEASTLCGGKLAPGESTAIHFRVRINADAPNGAIIANRAEVTIDDPMSGTSVTSSSNDASISLAVPDSAPVVESVERQGVHREPSRLVLRFSEPLDPASAQDLSNYQLFLIAHGGRLRIPVPLKSAVYDPAGRTVTLHPTRLLPLRRQYNLTIRGNPPQGLTSTTGIPLDGDGDGAPGGDHSRSFGREILSQSTRRAGAAHFRGRPVALRTR